MLYPDNKKSSTVPSTESGKGSTQMLRMIALIIAFISVFGFFFKLLFF